MRAIAKSKELGTLAGLARGNARLQSEMEYLSTYIWAILIIAVVLGALYYMGVFNSNTFAPRAQPGSCSVVKTEGAAQTIVPELNGNCNGELPQFVTQFNQYSQCISGNVPIYVNSIGETTMNQLTITAWVYITSDSSTNGLLHLATNNCVQGNFCGIWVNSNNHVNIGAGDTQANYPSNIIPDSWSFIAIVLNNAGGAEAYLNGNPGTPATWSGPLTGVSSFSMLGYLNGCTDTSVASISNVQIYNTAMNSNEIAQLYYEGIGGAPLSGTPLFHLVGWWPLNGDTNDYSGNGNNGVPGNIIYINQWLNGYTVP